LAVFAEGLQRQRLVGETAQEINRQIRRFALRSGRRRSVGYRVDEADEKPR
jgi:hypothetical protein